MGPRISKAGGQPGKTRLTALAILPNRDLAQQFLRTLPQSGAFQITAEWTSYPPIPALESQLRQVRPDVLLVDVSGNLEQAAALMESVAAWPAPVPVIGLHVANEADAVLRCLRAGAAEFLAAPFSADLQREAVTRIARLLPDQAPAGTRRASLLVFSSTKPGSGASTLAAHTAFALRDVAGGRILLADFDLWNGTTRLLFKLPEGPSLPHVLRAAESGVLGSGPEAWAALVFHKQGVDILAAASPPSAADIEASKLQKLLEGARAAYDWVVVDLPTVFDRLSLLVLADADHGFLVSTTELPSLHLTRKAVALLSQLGLGEGSFHVVVNRAGKGDGIAREAMAKIFKAPVYASFPQEWLPLHRALSAGQPLGTCALAKAIEDFAQVICARTRAGEAGTGVPALRRTG